MLQTLVLGLCLHKLPLELLHLLSVGACPSERLGKVTTHRLAPVHTVCAVLESGAQRRLRATVLVANFNLSLLVAVRDARVPRALQVTRDHLRQVADDLGDVDAVAHLVLDVSQR